jgi:hypothetical protein
MFPFIFLLTFNFGLIFSISLFIYLFIVLRRTILWDTCILGHVNILFQNMKIFVSYNKNLFHYLKCLFCIDGHELLFWHVDISSYNIHFQIQYT